MRGIDVAVTEIETILKTLLATPAAERPAALRNVADEQVARLEEARTRLSKMLEEADALRERLASGRLEAAA